MSSPDTIIPSTPKEISEIDLSTKEGKWLIAALSIISTESRTSDTPMEILGYVTELSKRIFEKGDIRDIKVVYKVD